MHILMTKITWDTDDYPVSDCNLPTNVLFIGLPDDWDEDEIGEYLEDEISDAFGYCTKSFGYDTLKSEDATHAGGGIYPKNLGVVNYVS